MIPDEDARSHDSSFDEQDDQDWGDWVDDDDETGLRVASSSHSTSYKVYHHALFRDEEEGGATSSQGEKHLKAFTTAQEAIAHAKSLGCDLLEVIKSCNLDALQIIRLLNRLRRQVVDPNKYSTPLNPRSVSQLTGEETFLTDDAELFPVPGYENDGLLQVDFDELISDDETKDTNIEARRIAELESQLKASQLAFEDLRKRYMDQAGLGLVHMNGDSKGKGRETSQDDSHYFTSYASHDIHQVMISDKVRTLSYAKFILSPHNAHLFRGKTIMDVGCGSGILSLFAARAGAKEVIAIDASDVADRAKENIKVNGMEGIITVYKGKVEDLQEQLHQYKGKVDVIISEWMGYFLLYESMLPSVLYARDEYLREGGLLTPSHTRMLLAAVEEGSVISNRLLFWDNIHGFSMQAMKTGLVDEVWTDTLDANQIVTDVQTIFELPLQTMTAKQPSFVAPFSLRVDKATSIRAFVSWFDTWFTPDGLPVPSEGRKDMLGGQLLDGLPEVITKCPEEKDIRGLDLTKGSIVSKATDMNEANGETVSFTTGPKGIETHWKQTLFVLKEPLEVEKGEC